MAELLRGYVMFKGESTILQAAEIVRVLGTPSAQDMARMNPNPNPNSDRSSIEELPFFPPIPWKEVRSEMINTNTKCYVITVSNN
jgi:hypothetical protein